MIGARGRLSAPARAPTSDPESTLDAWDRLPRRLFLDSSVLQTVMDYGEFVWENVPPPRGDRAYRIPGFSEDLEALRAIFQVNFRASFDIVVTQSVIDEVAAKGDYSYLSWALDVAAHWDERITEYRGRAFTGPDRSAAIARDPRLGYVSAKDLRLLADAIATEADAFLTMERRLTRNGEHFKAVSGLRLLRPPDYWALLRPWARLFS